MPVYNIQSIGREIKNRIFGKVRFYGGSRPMLEA